MKKPVQPVGETRQHKKLQLQCDTVARRETRLSGSNRIKTLHLLFLVKRHAIFQSKETVWMQRGERSCTEHWRLHSSLYWRRRTFKVTLFSLFTLKTECQLQKTNTFNDASTSKRDKICRRSGGKNFKQGKLEGPRKGYKCSNCGGVSWYVRLPTYPYKFWENLRSW